VEHNGSLGPGTPEKLLRAVARWCPEFAERRIDNETILRLTLENNIGLSEKSVDAMLSIAPNKEVPLDPARVANRLDSLREKSIFGHTMAPILANYVRSKQRGDTINETALRIAEILGIN